MTNRRSTWGSKRQQGHNTWEFRWTADGKPDRETCLIPNQIVTAPKHDGCTLGERGRPSYIARYVDVELNGHEAVYGDTEEA